jgi:hypothetical protein
MRPESSNARAAAHRLSPLLGTRPLHDQWKENRRAETQHISSSNHLPIASSGNGKFFSLKGVSQTNEELYNMTAITMPLKQRELREVQRRLMHKYRIEFVGPIESLSIEDQPHRHQTLVSHIRRLASINFA